MAPPQFPAGILPIDVAKSLRNGINEIRHAQAAYNDFAKTHEHDFSDETLAQLRRLDFEIGYARAGLTGTVQAILDEDDEAKSHA